MANAENQAVAVARERRAQADQSGVVPLVWSCHCMRLRLRYQWAVAVIMFSRAPVTATISGLPLAATFSLSRLQSRSESLNGVSLHRCAGRQHTYIQWTEIDCLWQFLSVDPLASGIPRTSQTLLSTNVTLGI
jgi:hypothetical protein